MNRNLFSLYFFAFLLVSFGCTSLTNTQPPSTQSEPSNQSEPEDVIAIIGDQHVFKDELISYYERNNPESDYTGEELREFLPYYIDFKLKLAYGEQNGMRENSEILEEYENYSKQAAFSYWLENDIKKELLDEFMERSKFEMKSHHVLIRLDERSSEAQAEQALVKLEEARELYISGEMTIEELDSEFSTQIQGRSAGGELPWFSAGVTVKPFEDTLFNLEPGEISRPVRTQFGYHLIYLDDRRERIPDRNISHIFFRENGDELSAEQLSQNAYEALEDGQPWDEVVREYSQDGASVNSSGDIGWIGSGTQFSEEFIGAVMQADTSLPYTEPFQTNYGYHIFRVDSVRTYSDEEHRTTELTRQLEELPRFTANRKQLLQRLAEVGNLQIDSETVNEVSNFFASSDTAAVKNLSPARSLAAKKLISFDSTEYSVSNFMEWLNEANSDWKASDFSQVWLESYEEYLIDSKVVDITRREFAEFDNEIEGFLHGLIVFQISDENIWNSETADSTALKAYYEEHKDQYQYGQRYDYTLLASSSDSVMNTALEKIHTGEDPLEFGEDMIDLVVSRDSVATPPEEIQNELADLETGEISQEFIYRNRKAHVIYNQILEPRIMTFDEAFHRVSSDYQPIREELFMARLRDQFSVQTYPHRIRK